MPARRGGSSTSAWSKPMPRMAVGQRAPLRGGGQAAVARRVEHDEVVAEAVHLGELELHGPKNTLRFAAMRLAPFAVAALAIFGGLQALFTPRNRARAGRAGGLPTPSSATSIPPPLIERGEFRLRPRAEFSATVRILHREDYSVGALAKLVPTDFAVGWGPMSDSAVLADIEISQGKPLLLLAHRELADRRATTSRRTRPTGT